MLHDLMPYIKNPDLQRFIRHCLKTSYVRLSCIPGLGTNPRVHFKLSKRSDWLDAGPYALWLSRFKRSQTPTPQTLKITVDKAPLDH